MKLYSSLRSTNLVRAVGVACCVALPAASVLYVATTPTGQQALSVGRLIGRHAQSFGRSSAVVSVLAGLCRLPSQRPTFVKYAGVEALLSVLDGLPTGDPTVAEVAEVLATLLDDAHPDVSNAVLETLTGAHWRLLFTVADAPRWREVVTATLTSRPLPAGLRDPGVGFDIVALTLTHRSDDVDLQCAAASVLSQALDAPGADTAACSSTAVSRTLTHLAGLLEAGIATVPPPWLNLLASLIHTNNTAATAATAATQSSPLAQWDSLIAPRLTVPFAASAVGLGHAAARLSGTETLGNPVVAIGCAALNVVAALASTDGGRKVTTSAVPYHRLLHLIRHCNANDAVPLPVIGSLATVVANVVNPLGESDHPSMSHIDTPVSLLKNPDEEDRGDKTPQDVSLSAMWATSWPEAADLPSTGPTHVEVIPAFIATEFALRLLASKQVWCNQQGMHTLEMLGRWSNRRAVVLQDWVLHGLQMALERQPELIREQCSRQITRGLPDTLNRALMSVFRWTGTGYVPTVGPRLDAPSFMDNCLSSLAYIASFPDSHEVLRASGAFQAVSLYATHSESACNVLNKGSPAGAAVCRNESPHPSLQGLSQCARGLANMAAAACRVSSAATSPTAFWRWTMGDVEPQTALADELSALLCRCAASCDLNLRAQAHRAQHNVTSLLSGDKTAPVYLDMVLPLCDDTKGAAPDAPTADVVFIHGIDGGPYKTWRSTGPPPSACASVMHTPGVLTDQIGDAVAVLPTYSTVVWPQAWLPKDPVVLQSGLRLRLLTVQYNGDFLTSTSSSVERPLEDLGSQLSSELLAAGVGKHRPVLFVVHSYGGLAAKQVLTHGVTPGDGTSDYLLNHTAGVLFEATPHRGSPVAVNHAGTMWFASTALSAPLLQVLHENSPPLLALDDAFTRAVEASPATVDVLSVGESLPSLLFKGVERMVVPPESARARCGSFVLMDVDHYKINKPPSPDDVRYTVMRDFIVQAATKFGKKKGVVEEVEEVEKRQSANVVAGEDGEGEEKAGEGKRKGE